MLERKIRIVNPLGLHARAAAKLVRLSAGFSSSITLSQDGRTANARSILKVLALAAPQGTTVELTVDGVDEAEAAAAIVDLFETGFGEI